MTLRLFTIEEKLAALHVELVEARRELRPPGSNAQRHYEILKSIGADLQARRELPRNNALGDLERRLAQVARSKTALGYDRNQMAELANVVINKWSVISQALECFGEVSAE